jgi:group I intron endonuclease
MSSFVYILENCSETNARYVGKANDPVARFKNHCGVYHLTNKRCYASYLYGTMKKTGHECWQLHVVEEYFSEAEALDGERDWISYLKSMGVKLYNLTPGGYGGFVSKDANQKRSESLKGRIPWNCGQKLSEEIKRKMLASHMGMKMPIRTKEWSEKQRISQLKEFRKCSVCNVTGHDKRNCKEKSS